MLADKPRWEVEGRAWPLREASRFVETDRLRWHVQQMGQGPVVLDCAPLTWIDSAAVGSLILLYAACMAAKRPWAIINPSASLRRQFELMCAQYLLEPLR